MIIEVCKNEIDQGRGEFLNQKAIFEGTTYEYPYQTLIKKVKYDKIILYEKIQNEKIETMGMDPAIIF